MMRAFKMVVLVSLGFSFSGCMVGPDYKPPVNAVPDNWKTVDMAGDKNIKKENPNISWWKELNDPLLDKYIDMACLNNKDVLRAESAILKARALRQVAASSLFPQLSFDANASRMQFSKNGPLITANNLLPQVPLLQNLFNTLFDMSWEIDLFGKTRRKVQAAEAFVGASLEDLNDILITVIAEVARNYVEVRGSQKKASLINQNIFLLEENVKIVKEQLIDGYVNELDLKKIEAELSNAKAELPDVIAETYKGIYTISILTGALPETLFDELIKVQDLPSLPKEVAVGIRSDLLRRRPDIRRAERKLAEATAEIGVAVASFYPTITLGANLGLQALHVRKLFRGNSKNWEYGGDFNLPIFQGGKLVGNLKATRAQESEAAYFYQKTVLSALEEAESAIVAYTKQVETSLDYGRATEDRKQLVVLTQNRYEKGLVDLLNLIGYQRELVFSEKNQLLSDTFALLKLIGLYKALGGGWEKEKNQN